MRIGCISSTVFSLPVSGYAGLEHLAWQRAKGLAELGHDVTVFVPDGSTCPGCTIIPFGAVGQIDERIAFHRTWQQLGNFDVIIDDSWAKFSTLLRIEGRIKTPILQVMHAPVNTMMQELPPFEKPCFVCISQDQADHFEALYSPDKYQRNRVLAKVAYNGIDLDVYKSLDIPKSDRYLFFARFSTVKGPSIALDVCQKADVGLDLVGDCSITNEPQYLQECQRMADGVKRKIIGGVPRGEAVYWYSRSKALLHTAKHFREPFGLAPVESMAAGCPVACFNHGALRETVVHGETGYIVDSENELVELIRNDAFSQLKPERCREQALQFSIQRMVKRYETLCQEAIEGGW